MKTIRCITFCRQCIRSLAYCIWVNHWLNAEGDSVYGRWFLLVDYENAAPEAPGSLQYVGSSNSSLTVSWNQTGRVDGYLATVNGSISNFTYGVSYSGVGNSTVIAVIDFLPVAGDWYCLTVTALSYSLYSSSTSGCFVTSRCYLRAFLHVVKHSAT